MHVIMPLKSLDQISEMCTCKDDYILRIQMVDPFVKVRRRNSVTVGGGIIMVFACPTFVRKCRKINETPRRLLRFDKPVLKADPQLFSFYFGVTDWRSFLSSQSI